LILAIAAGHHIAIVIIVVGFAAIAERTNRICLGFSAMALDEVYDVELCGCPNC
jgi:hypothetical protein